MCFFFFVGLIINSARAINAGCMVIDGVRGCLILLAFVHRHQLFGAASSRTWEKTHTHTVSLVLRQTQCRLNSNVIYWQLCPSPIFLFLPTPRLSLALHRHRPFPFIPHFRCSEQTFDGVRLLSMKVQFEVPFFFFLLLLHIPFCVCNALISGNTHNRKRRQSTSTFVCFFFFFIVSVCAKFVYSYLKGM